MFQIDRNRSAVFKRALKRLAQPDRRWVSFHLLDIVEITALRELCNRQLFRKASKEVGLEKKSVFQDFEVCFPAPRINAIDSLAKLLEVGLYQAGREIVEEPIKAPFIFNDFAIQKYASGSHGIGIHRDGLRYKHIVVIINLAGKSQLFVSKDREGNERKVINDKPGRIVLLSASRFAGREGDKARPLHGVDHVKGGRLSLGLRIQDV
ncbi:hypothetical protein N8500_07925 [Candidatus Puniceispirillum sp.]|nr:hypothetical protein [Candidatus Puniceispirillum sp.]